MNEASLDRINSMRVEQAWEELSKCCGARHWVEKMLRQRPFTDIQAASDAAWTGMMPGDWIQAFSHHPKIGDLESMAGKFAGTAKWASGEQAGTAGASQETLRALMAANAEYEKKFGYIFIVCATEKSADEMLGILKSRLANEPDAELSIAAEEQKKITRLRLEKLLR